MFPPDLNLTYSSAARRKDETAGEAPIALAGFRRFEMILAFIVSFFLRFQVPAQVEYPAPFPRDGAVAVVDNDRVTVWDVTWPKNKPTAMHKHVYDLVGIELADATVAVTTLNGRARSSNVSRGHVLFLSKDTIHMEEGLSDNPRHATLIDLKNAPSPAYPNKSALPLAFPRDGAKQLLDNSRVTIWDYTWKPGQPTPMHFHDKDTVVVYMEDGELKSTTPDGQSNQFTIQSGRAQFSTGNRAHSEELIKGNVRAIIVELK